MISTVPHADLVAPAASDCRVDAGNKLSTGLYVRSRDVEEQASYLAGWDQHYVQLSPGQFDGSLIQTWFGDIQFIREKTNRSIHETGRSWPDSRTLCVPLAMSGETWFRGMHWLPDTCATMGGDVDLDLRTSQGFDVIAISLKAQRLADLAEQSNVSAGQLEQLLSGGSIARIAPAMVAELRRMVTELAMLVEQQSVLLSHVSVCQSIENAVYETVCNVITKSVDVRNASQMYLPRRQLVRRAIEFVSEHPDRIVTVAELCQVLRVSRRTLQEYFEDVLHVSPIQYLRAYRLNRVRAALRSGETIRVREAAARFGFWNLSQFSQDYKRLFGELPSQTINPSGI
jgi:AraC family ethanolamine operon transcriptional activator